MYSEQVDRIFKYLGVKLSTKHTTSPIHLRPVVSAFGLYIEHLPFPDDVSGMLVRSNKGNFVLLNENHHYHRRRFSLGHEFGHYYLDHPIDVSTSTPEDIMRRAEIEANKFSSCMLMPIQLVSGLAKRDMNIPELARWFRVSVVAAAIRCKDLGYRVYEAEDIIHQYWMEQGDKMIDEWFIDQVSATYE